jgi:hypothetical protein
LPNGQNPYSVARHEELPEVQIINSNVTEGYTENYNDSIDE